MLARLTTLLLAVAAATVLVLVFARPDQARLSDESAGPTPTGGDLPSGEETAETTATTGPTSVGDPAPDATAAASRSAQPDDGAASAAPVPHDARQVEVVSLADGDSFTIRWIDPRPDDVRRDEVRMRGINAPERDACFGTEARDRLESLIGGQPVLIDIAFDEWDDFGRAVADVWTADADHANVAMAEQGAALAFSDGGPHAESIRHAAAAARGAGRGLWGVCTIESDLVISDLIADAAGRDDLNPNGEWIEIANGNTTPADLTGWGIRDESTRHRFYFPDGYFLAAGATVRIGSGCDHHDNADRVDLTWCASDPVWNNGGDTAFLLAPDGRFADYFTYPHT